jgi:uncharacterized repeat protein (TIGR01451 family)
MNRYWLLIGIVLWLATPLTVLAEQDVRFESKAEIEVQETDQSGKKTWIRQPAKLVPPGTMVIYTNTFTNQGEEPAENLVVTNPVPQDMVYLSGSAMGENADITFSVDSGETFANENELTITGQDGAKRLAEPKDITHIRWLIKTPLPPGAAGSVEYRAQLL